MVSGIIFAMIVVLGVIALLVALVAARTRQPGDEPGLYPEGHYRGIGMSGGRGVGLMLGAGVGLAIKNIALGAALGPALGSGLGVARGAGLERRNQHKTRPLTPRERSAKTTSRTILIVVAAMTVVALAATLFLLRAA